MNEWMGTARNDRELAFWGESYLMVLKKLITEEHYRQHQAGDKLFIKKRIDAAADFADTILGHFQTACDCMEDRQAEERKGS